MKNIWVYIVFILIIVRNCRYNFICYTKHDVDLFIVSLFSVFTRNIRECKYFKLLHLNKIETKTEFYNLFKKLLSEK